MTFDRYKRLNYRNTERRTGAPVEHYDKWNAVINTMSIRTWLPVHLGAPVATYVSTSCLLRHSTYRNAQPAPRSYVPYCGNLDAYTDRMSFLQRAHNFLLWLAAYIIDYVAFTLSSWRL